MRKENFGEDLVGIDFLDLLDMLLVWGIARTYTTLMYQFVAIKLGKEGGGSKEKGSRE